ncbi:MAG: hypothetical protein M3Y05_17345 [Gemmatimonadota bacterium]|nr:hypothetical protein [Gemmatimonadota bacterium]
MVHPTESPERVWIEISADSDADQASSKLFRIGFDLRPRSKGVRLDAMELLRIGEMFFRRLMLAFVNAGGRIHVFARGLTNRDQLSTVVESESAVDSVLADLLLDRPESVYPIVAWVEPKTLRRSRWISEEDLDDAASDFELLDDLITSGLPRLFLDAEFADLLADHADGNPLREWIERAAEGSPNVTVNVRN